MWNLEIKVKPEFPSIHNPYEIVRGESKTGNKDYSKFDVIFLTLKNLRILFL